MNTNDIQKLVKKMKIQEQNGCNTDKTMMKILENIPPMTSEEWDKIDKEDRELLESHIGKLSPFFFREVEQFRDLILEYYQKSKKTFASIKKELGSDKVAVFCEEVTIVDTACGKLMELLLKRAKEYSCQDIEVPRLAPIFNTLPSMGKISSATEMLINQLEDGYKAMDILLCPETFEELLDMERTDHYWTYANFFFAEYSLFYEPAMFLTMFA